MQLKTMQIFCDLAETGNFTMTAQRHGITQSAISQQIFALEENLNAGLILRGRKKFRLTREGEIFLQSCLEITRLAEEMGKRLEKAAATSRETIELATCSSIGLHQLPPVLNRFRHDFPSAKINVRYEQSDRVYDLVLEGAVNLGLVAYPRRLPGLTVDRFRLERLVLVCHPQHPLATRQPVRMRNLINHKFAAWTDIRPASIFADLPAELRQKFEPVHEFSEIEMVKRAVEVDEVVAILPEAIVREEVAGGRLAAVPFEDDTHTEPLAVIYRTDRELTPVMEHFIQALKQPEPGKTD